MLVFLQVSTTKNINTFGEENSIDSKVSDKIIEDQLSNNFSLLFRKVISLSGFSKIGINSSEVLDEVCLLIFFLDEKSS